MPIAQPVDSLHMAWMLLEAMKLGSNNVGVVFVEVHVSRAQAIMIGRVWIGYASFLSESEAPFNLIPTMHTTTSSGLDASLLHFLLPPTTFNV